MKQPRMRHWALAACDWWVARGIRSIQLPYSANTYNGASQLYQNRMLKEYKCISRYGDHMPPESSATSVRIGLAVGLIS